MNKKILTVKHFQKNNNNSKKITSFICIPLTVIIGLSVLSIACYEFVTNKKLTSVIFICLFIGLIFLGSIPSQIENIKKENKENKHIENRNFKIVEDKIYDKDMYYTSNRNKNSMEHSNKEYHYFIFTKIYGKIFVDRILYENAHKNDSIYLVFYDGDENLENHKHNFSKYKFDEEYRNANIIDQKYLASQYDLSSDLTYNFIPYDKELGESNFQNRIITHKYF